MSGEPLTFPTRRDALPLSYNSLQLFENFEPLKGIEPLTSSLPRKCSTTELQRRMPVDNLPLRLGIDSIRKTAIKNLSGRRGSNPRPTAWKAVALPTELLPLLPAVASAQTGVILIFWYSLPAFAKAKAGAVGKDGFEPPNSEEDRFTVCCRWPLGYLPLLSQRRDSNPRPADYKSAALPTELLWHVFIFT